MPDPTDTQIHDALVAYTSAEPPLSFTYDEVLAGGRRARRHRRLAVAGAAAAVTAVAAAGGSLARLLVHDLDSRRVDFKGHPGTEHRRGQKRENDRAY